jgi:hypothetical protein
MAASVFKHQDDDGTLSVFASGDVVVLSCEHGHYWVLEAEEQSSETVKPALRSALSEERADVLLRAL